MSGPALATRDDLLRWPSTVAAGEFPRLLRRLIWETVPDALRLGFPAGSGTSAGSWDGSVRTVVGTAYVPAGLSVWELSVQANGIGAKADGDYGKRTSTPDGSPVAEAVYVEAMLRPWTDRRDWAAGKRRDNRWRNVIGYGVDDIEEWLESAPVTHSWVSEMLNLAPHGYRAAERWWTGWATATSPRLAPGVVLAGRDAAVLELERRLGDAPTITTIRGGSREECLAFIAAALARLASEGDTRLRSRAVFVDQVASWRALAERPGPLILAPVTQEVAAEASHGASHHIVIPVAGASADIEVPAIESRTATAVLRADGLGEGAAERAGKLARRSLTAMRRSLANNPALHNPPWASDPSRTLRGLLVAGRWNEDYGADRGALGELTGEGYDDTLRETLARLNRAIDPFVTQIGSAWMLTALQDAWVQLRDGIRKDDLDRLRPVVQRVLLERDPALDLPPEDRWRAGLDGKTLMHSPDLRRGLARTLAAIGAHGHSIDTGHGTNGSQWAAHVVGELLGAANADRTGDTWNSLSGVLPQLAEAAPDAFLDGVRDAALGDDPVIVTIFVNNGSPMAISGFPRHQQLLWALEALAWSPEHLGRVALHLARLAEIFPDGTKSSDPFESLAAILFLQQPQTSVPATGRMAVFEGVRARHPEIAWRLMLALLPSNFAVHGATPGPEFRDWKPQERVAVTVGEWLDSVRKLVGLLIDDAAGDTSRWRQILEMFPFLPEADRERVRSALAAQVEAGTLDHDEQVDLWEDLRRLIASHRAHSDSQGFLQAAELDALEGIEQGLAPSGLVQRFQWLFARQLPELGDCGRGDPAYETTLRALRVGAVTEIEGLGIDAVRDLAAGATDPRVVGMCLAESAADIYRSELLAAIPAGSTDAALAEGWLAGRFRSEGWTWLDALLTEELGPDQQALALLASREYPKAWRVADERGAPVAEAFWRNFSINGLGRDFAHTGEAANRLAQAGRVAAALELAVIYENGLGDDSVDLVIGLLRKFSRGYMADPEARLVGEHEFRSIFRYLDRHAERRHETELVQLEWLFLGGLGFEPSAERLRAALTTDAELFTQIMQFAWRASDSDSDHEDGQNDAWADGEPLTEVEAQRVTNAYALLTSLNQLPGAGPDGRVDYGALSQWTARVLELASESGRRGIAESLIGLMLASAPSGDDGAWPCEAVRDLLEDLQSERVERSLADKLYNNRGVSLRDAEDGGKQEERLAERYNAQAAALSDRWPQASAVLRKLATTYETDSRQEETRAERYRQGQQA